MTGVQSYRAADPHVMITMGKMYNPEPPQQIHCCGFYELVINNFAPGSDRNVW